MENLNVSTMDTRDSKGRGRFFPFNPDNHYFPGDIHAGDYWYWDYIYYPPTQVCLFTCHYKNFEFLIDFYS